MGVLGLLAVWSADGRALELPPVVVDPAVAGPTMQPPGSLPRTPTTVRDALGSVRAELVECYRWARFRQPALGASTFTVEMRLDEAGTVSRAAVESPASTSDGGARACLREALGTVSVGLYTSRLTDVTFTLRLSPSGQGRPRRSPARPHPAARATASPARRCRAAAATGVDRLQLEDLRIDDFSQEQDRQENLEQVRRDHRAWVRGGRVGPEPVAVPDVIAGCATSVRGAFKPAALTRAIAANAGAYAACFAASDQQSGGAAPARAKVSVDVGGDGRFCSARVEGSVGSRLARCLEAAVEDVWLPSAPNAQPVHVIVPIVRGAPAAAQPPAPEPTCARRLAEFQRRLDGSPWLADPRLFAIADDIGADAERAPRTSDRDACWQHARELMAGAVIALHKSTGSLFNQDVMPSVIAGYDWLLRQRPALPDDVSLRFYRAEALWCVGRWTDAARAYAEVRERAPQGRYAKDAAYASVLAWSNAIDGVTSACCADAPPPATGAARAAPQPLSAGEKELVGAIDAYVRLVPDAPDAARLIKRRADLLARAAPAAAGATP